MTMPKRTASRINQSFAGKSFRLTLVERHFTVSQSVRDGVNTNNSRFASQDVGVANADSLADVRRLSVPDSKYGAAKRP